MSIIGNIGNILVKLGLDSSQFTRGARDAGKSTQDFVSKAETSFKKLLGFGVFGYTLKKAFDFTSESYTLNSQMQGVKKAFEHLNKPDLLNNLRQATQSTMSDLKLMQLSVQAKNFRLPLEQMGTYLKFATDRARETGQSVDYLVNSIVTGLGRKSILILDNLGISAVEIREEMAKGGDMAEAVGRIIQREMGNANSVLNDSVNLAEKSASSWDNAKTAIGGFSIIKNVGDWFHKASASVADFLTKIFSVNNAISENEKLIREEGKQVNYLISKLANVNTKEEDRRGILLKLQEIQPKIVEGLSNENIETKKLISTAREYNRELVARIALAAKQDIVTSATNKQIEAGANLMSKELEISQHLLNLQNELSTAKLERGYSSFEGKGVRTKWEPISEQKRQKLISDLSDIISGTDEWNVKLEKTHKLFANNPMSTEQLRGISLKPTRDLLSEYGEINREVVLSGEAAEQAKKEVEEFKQTFASIFETKTQEEATEQISLFTKLIANIQKAESQIASLQSQAQKSGYNEQLTKDISDLEVSLTGLTETYKTLTGKEWGAKIEVDTDKERLKQAINGSVAYIENEISKLELKIKLTTDDVERANLLKEVGQLKAVLKTKLEVDYQKGSELDLKSQLSDAETEMSKLNTRTEEGRKRFAELNKIIENINWQIAHLPQNITIDYQVDFDGLNIDSMLDEAFKDWDEYKEKIKQSALDLQNTLEQGVEHAIMGLGEAIGNLASGNTDAVWQALLNPIADMAVQLGQLAIVAGITFDALGNAMKNPFGGGIGAIAAGVALVALGTAIKGAISNIGSGGGGSSGGYGNTFTGGYSNGGSTRTAQSLQLVSPQSQQTIVVKGQLTGGELKFILGKEEMRRNR